MKEVGIFGGTFSPIHLGHVAAANRFYDALALDRLLVIPAFSPPHKEEDGESTPEQRLEMTRLAFEGNPREIEVSDFEILSGGKSYTYLTLRHFYSPQVRLTLLCGTDMFLTLDSWKHPDEIFSLCRVALIRRERENPATEEKIAQAKRLYEEKYWASLLDVLNDPVEISSTAVREKLRRGEEVAELLPPPVLSYIRAHRLYGIPDGK